MTSIVPVRSCLRWVLLVMAAVTGCSNHRDPALALASTAAAQKARLSQAQNEAWAALAAAIPDEMTLRERRIDAPGKFASRGQSAGEPPAPGDLMATRSGLREGAALWSKAQAAFATGNMEEAVATAKNLKLKLDRLAAESQPTAPATAPTPTAAAANAPGATARTPP